MRDPAGAALSGGSGPVIRADTLTEPRKVADGHAGPAGCRTLHRRRREGPADDPVVFIESKLLYGQRGEVPEGEHLVPLGEATVRREGEHVTLVAYSRMVGEALQAAEALAKHGVSAEVVDLRCLAPLDMDTVAASVEKTGRVVAIEEGNLTGGVAAEIVARIVDECFDYLDAAPRRVAALDVPVPASGALEQAATPDWQDIARAAAEVLRAD